MSARALYQRYARSEGVWRDRQRPTRSFVFLPLQGECKGRVSTTTVAAVMITSTDDDRPIFRGIGEEILLQDAATSKRVLGVRVEDYSKEDPRGAATAFVLLRVLASSSSSSKFH